MWRWQTVTGDECRDSEEEEEEAALREERAGRLRCAFSACACLLLLWVLPLRPRPPPVTLGEPRPPPEYSHEQLASHRAFGMYVADVIDRQSSCVPDRTSVISLTNEYYTNITALQMATMPRCVLPRTALYCSRTLATFAPARSFRDHCFVSNEDMSPGPFQTDEYTLLIILKWRLMARALQSSDAVLFLDADVLVIHDPFPALAGITTPLAMQRVSYGNPFHPMKNHVNSGVVWLRSHALALVLEKVVSSPYDGELDQDAVQRYLDVQNPPRHTLLPTCFAGHPWARWSFVRFLIMLKHKAFVTYHAHGVHGIDNKLAVLRHVAETTP